VAYGHVAGCGILSASLKIPRNGQRVIVGKSSLLLSESMFSQLNATSKSPATPQKLLIRDQQIVCGAKLTKKIVLLCVFEPFSTGRKSIFL
jgi:hypothetical protein